MATTRNLLNPPAPPSASQSYTCCECKQTRPGEHYLMLSTMPPKVGDSFYVAKRGKNKGKLVKYSRTEWKKRVIDPSRPCRACRARAASKRSYAKKQERIEQAKAEARAQYTKDQAELPIDLLPREPRLLKGPDTVLEQMRVLIANARARLREAKEGVRLGVTAGNTQYHDAMLFLLRARIAVFKMVRHQRHIDLLNPLLTNDTLRMHWWAYIDREIRNEMDDLAYKVNALAPPGQRRPWKGLPDLALPRGDKFAPDGTPRKEFVCAKAWAPLLESIKLTAKASHAALRSRHSKVASRRVPVYGADTQGRVGSFSIEDFHMRRLECTEAAEREIRRAIEDYVHPAGWVAPWDEGAHAARAEGVASWRALVPPRLRAEIEWMWNQMPDVTRKRLLPFPRLSATKDRRNGFQILNGLNENNARLPPPAPAFDKPDEALREVSVMPEPEEEAPLPILSGTKRKPLKVVRTSTGWAPVNPGKEDGLETNYVVTEVPTKETK